MLSMFREQSMLSVEQDVACISVHFGESLTCWTETCLLGLPEHSLITVPTTQSRLIDTCFQIPTQFLEILIILNGNIFETICGKINKNICGVSGFRRSVLDVFALLGYYAALFGSRLPKFRDSLQVPSSKGRNVDKQLPTKAA